MAYFITGGGGTIGRNIISHILDGFDSDVYILVRSQKNRESLINFLSAGGAGRPKLEKIKFVEGDITEKNCGVSADQAKQMSGRITHLIHSAASTQFDWPLDRIREVNVAGTRNAFSLAENFNRLEQAAFMSTAYVSGKRTGVIREDELEHEAGFVNTYEQSKYEAEEFIKSISANAPVAVYRFSTIVGDSRTGRVDHFTAPQQAWRIMYLGLASMLPGKPDYYVDLIPLDSAVQIFMDLFIKNFTQDKTYHIVAGRDKSFSLQQLVDKSFESLARHDGNWAKRNYPRPSIVSSEAFDLFIDSVEKTNNPIMAKVLSAIRHFAHQLSFPKEFDISNALEAAPEAVDAMPHVEDYYDKVINYCLKTRWGRNYE